MVARSLASIALGALLLPGIALAPEGRDSTPHEVIGKVLFCAYGSIGMKPTSPPPGFESEFAEAVIALHSSKNVSGESVTGFDVISASGKTYHSIRTVEIERFAEKRVASEGSMAFYLDTKPGSTTTPWNGVVPSGDIRLRLRVALREDPRAYGGRCRIRIGSFTFEGRIDGEWPT